jgi:hypothetical protein
MVGKRSRASGIGLERLCTEPSSDWMRSTDAVNGVELLEAWFQGHAYHKHRHEILQCRGDHTSAVIREALVGFLARHTDKVRRQTETVSCLLMRSTRGKLPQRPSPVPKSRV